ncbi:hypothetical protein HII36_27735 [Nonomuraea sp. NN258]|uniref:hypothetical protein n=1 Tax=Nonomuraea antri TaxID=2730852 RepID=UPI001567DA5B|nr:hypothetical protein [Nonomuraea antri]NRQ35596.1 hypothetical protein [Nonomuraea antri]
MRKTAKLLLTAGVIACGLAGTTPAQAATAANPYDPAAVCGSGFRVIDSHPFTSGGTKLATVYLSYKGSTGENCVVTLNHTVSTIWMRATLSVQGGATRSDAKEYRYYAGPVKLRAAGKCVKWGGTWDEAPFSWTSGWSHCG